MSTDITKPIKETIDIEIGGVERADWDIERLGESRARVPIPGSSVGATESKIKAYGSFEQSVLYITAGKGSSAPECDIIIDTAVLEAAVRAKKGEVVIAFLPTEVRQYYDMALLAKEIIADLPDVLKQWEKEKLERAEAVLRAVRNETSYFRANPSEMADVIERRIKFATTVGKGESIEDGILYSWHGTYVADGESRISVHMEAVRSGILDAMERAKPVLLPIIQEKISQFESELKKIQDEIGEGGHSRNEESRLQAEAHEVEMKIMEMYGLFAVPEVKLTRNFKSEIVSAIKARALRPVESMNPPTHVPFKDCYISTETWKPEEPDPSLFFTFQVHATVLNGHSAREVQEGTYRPPDVTLDDVPKFKKLLQDAYYEEDWPLLMSYMGYTFYSRLPAQKVLFILGKEGSSKGTTIRLLDRLLGDAVQPIDFARLIETEKFPTGDIRNATVLVDREMRRTFRRGTMPTFNVFNMFFGGDTGPFELKFHSQEGYRNHAKGIVVSNLPIFLINDSPALRRIMVVITKVPEKGRKVVKDLDESILRSEKDKIARLFLQHLQSLSLNNWEFPGDKGIDEYARILENTADSVRYFQDERTMPMKGYRIKVDDAYKEYAQMCGDKGIAPDPVFSFTARLGRIYPKKRGGPRTARYYYFSDCAIVDEEGKIIEAYNIKDSQPPEDRKESGQKKLDTGVEGSNPPNNGPPGNTKDGVQPLCYPIRVKENDNEENYTCNRHAQKLDTGGEEAETPHDTASTRTESGVQPSKGVKNLPSESDDDFGRVAYYIKQQMEKHEWHGMVDSVHRKIYLIRGQNDAVVHLQNDIMHRNGFSLNIQQTTGNEMIFDWTSNYNKEAPL